MKKKCDTLILTVVSWNAHNTDFPPICAQRLLSGCHIGPYSGDPQEKFALARGEQNAHSNIMSQLMPQLMPQLMSHFVVILQFSARSQAKREWKQNWKAYIIDVVHEARIIKYMNSHHVMCAVYWC